MEKMAFLGTGDLPTIELLVDSGFALLPGDTCPS